VVFTRQLIQTMFLNLTQFIQLNCILVY